MGKRLRYLGVLAAVAVLVALALVFRQPGERSAPPPAFAGHGADFNHFSAPRPVPALAFTDREGAQRTLADWKGKVVLLNFWATWCAPCVREMPALDRLQAELSGEGFEVVAVSVDRDGLKVVEPFFARHKITSLKPYLDPSAGLMRGFGLGGLPVTFLIGRDGRALGQLDGSAEWDSPEGKRFMRFYLDQPQAGG